MKVVKGYICCLVVTVTAIRLEGVEAILVLTISRRRYPLQLSVNASYLLHFSFRTAGCYWIVQATCAFKVGEGALRNSEKVNNFTPYSLCLFL